MREGHAEIAIAVLWPDEASMESDGRVGEDIQQATQSPPEAFV